MLYLKTITITTVILAGLSPILSEFLLDNPLRYCKEKGDCVELPEEEILERYGNMFYTEEQIEKKIHTLAMRNENDLCCPSKIMHTYSNTMLNVNGAERIPVRFMNPERRQFIPTANCLNKGKCLNGGTCRLQPISVWLLVLYKQFGRWHITFDEFEIPGYCSCKTN